MHGVGLVVLDEQDENVTATLPGLQPDAYRLDWRTVSADDLHPVSGTVVFGVQRSVTGSGSANAPAPPAAELGLRAVDLIASAGLVGALVVWIWVLPPFIPWVRRRHGEDSVVMLGHLDRVCLGLATAMSIGCLAASTTLAAVEIAARTGSGFGHAWTLLRTSASGPWIVMRTLTVAAAVALLIREWRRRGRSPAAERPIGGRPGLLVFVTFVALTFDAQTSHLAGTGLTATVLTVHRIAASVWIGGVGVLAVLLLPGVARLDRPARRELVRAFGPLAAASAAVLVVTGLLLASRQVATFDALLQTFYGHVLTIKLLVFGIVAGLGLRNAVAVRRRSQATGPPSARSLSVEAITGSTVLALAAALTLAVPATGARFTGPLAGEPPGPVTGQADDLLVTVAVRPNRPGENYVTMNVQDTRRPAPAPITDVRVSMRSAQRTVGERARRAEDGRFDVVGDQFDRAGRWAITVAIERPSLRDAVFVVPWTIGPPISSTRLPTKVSARPLAPILQTVALLTAALFVGAAALRLARRKRSPACHARRGGRVRCGSRDSLPEFTQRSPGLGSGAPFPGGAGARSHEAMAGLAGAVGLTHCGVGVAVDPEVVEQPEREAPTGVTRQRDGTTWSPPPE